MTHRNKNSSTIVPLHNKVLLELVQKETTTSSGIILSRPDSDEANRGKVLQIGPEVTQVSVNDIVLVDWNRAIKLEKVHIQGETKDAYVIEETDIILVFDAE